MSPFRRSGRVGGDESALTVDEIRALQRALLARGYDLGSSGADGVLGSVGSTTSKTRAAIRSFQISRGIASPGQSGYGMLGPRTQAALAEAVPSATRSEFARGLELFSSGSYAAAAAAFEAVHRASGDAGVLFNAGRAYEESGDDAAAVRAYEALLASGSAGSNEQEARRRLEGARARLSAVRALTAAPPPGSPGAPPAPAPGAPAPAPAPAPGAPAPAPAPGAPSPAPRLTAGVPGYAWAVIGLGVVGIVGAVAASMSSREGRR